MIDAASCTYGLLNDVKNYLDDDHRARFDQITILDSIAWCHDLLPRLTISHRLNRVAVYPIRSTQPHLRDGHAASHRQALRVIRLPPRRTHQANPADKHARDNP